MIKMSQITWEIKISKKIWKTKKILEEMPVLLPVYQMLQHMTPHCCDINPDSQSNNPCVSHSCELNTLSGEAAA